MLHIKLYLASCQVIWLFYFKLVRFLIICYNTLAIFKTFILKIVYLTKLWHLSNIFSSNILQLFTKIPSLKEFYFLSFMAEKRVISKYTKGHLWMLLYQFHWQLFQVCLSVSLSKFFLSTLYFHYLPSIYFYHGDFVVLGICKPFRVCIEICRQRACKSSGKAGLVN